MLKDTLQQELTNALKNKDTVARSVLGMLMTAIQNKGLAKRTQYSKTVTDIDELQKQSILTDEEVVEVIASEVKKRKDAKEQFIAGDRKDLAEKEQTEIDVLAKYLPEQLSDEEVKQAVTQVISQMGAQGPSDMGRVMGSVMKELKGKADGSLVQRFVKEALEHALK